MKNIILGLVLFYSTLMAVEVGSVPPPVTISGKNGGKLDGSAWHSSMLKDKVYIFFYVDPDERDLNNLLADTLQGRHFDRKKVNSVAVINLAATWLPNIILESALKKKQKKYPNTLYVKDKHKVLVKKWKLADDDSNVLIFNKQGKILYRKFGKVTAKEVPSVVRLIERNL